MRKNVVRAAATVAQTIRRRILLTGGSDVVSTPVLLILGRGATQAGVALAAAGVTLVFGVLADRF